MLGLLWLECGGSRCQGLYVEKYGPTVPISFEPGFNATSDDINCLKAVVNTVRVHLEQRQPQYLLLGAAGLTVDEASKAKKVLAEVWPESHIQVFNDLEALGRAYAKHSVVGILGTGASAALWDGQRIQRTGPSLGWIVGDEGSGAWLGKQMVRDRFYAVMPEPLWSSFDQFAVADSRSAVLKKIYSSGGRAWLAGLTRWLALPEVRRMDWAQRLLRSGFEAYLRHQVKPLIDLRSSEALVLAGGVAWHFRQELEEVARAEGLTLTSVTPSATAILQDLSAEEIFLRLSSW